MTLNAAAHPSHAPIVANPGASRRWRLRLIAADTLAGAWFFQLVLDIRPCPLCLEQRYAYYLAVPLGLPSRSQHRAGRRGRVLLAGFAVLALAALANAWLGGYHAGVEWGFWRARPIAPVRSRSRQRRQPAGALDTVKVIRCDEVQWRFLGLSLAGYNVLISLAMAAIAVWGIVSAKRA